MEISGVIQSGAGKGAFFTQVDWVVDQCVRNLGYRPFPGTLNVHISNDYKECLNCLKATMDARLIPDDPSFCTAQLKKVQVNGIPAAVIIPAEDVRVHEGHILEIICACGIKETLGLEDGDTVSLSWKGTPPASPSVDAIDENERSDHYREIYEFAASAGALEGYVHPRQQLTADHLDNWVRNIVKQYHDLPPAVQDSVQPALDRTLGRAVQALGPILGVDHAHVRSLSGLIVGQIPDSPFDFEKEKEEKADRYGK